MTPNHQVQLPWASALEPRQHLRDLAPAVFVERSLGRQRIADRKALELERALDAGGEGISREGLVHGPELALQRHSLVPFAALGMLVEGDALARHDAGRPRHPADAADQ